MYVEPESMCKSKGSNSDWIDVLVGLVIFMVIEAEMHCYPLLIMSYTLMGIASQLDAVDPVKRSGSVPSWRFELKSLFPGG